MIWMTTTINPAPKLTPRGHGCRSPISALSLFQGFQGEGWGECIQRRGGRSHTGPFPRWDPCWGCWGRGNHSATRTACFRTRLNTLVFVVALALGSCARPDWIEQTLVTVDVTGVWVGGTRAGGGTGIQLEPEQQGAKVKCKVRAVGAATHGPWGTLPSGPVDGIVAGDVFSFSQTNGVLKGEMTVAGNEMTGTITAGGRYPISLQRSNSSSHPTSQ